MDLRTLADWTLRLRLLAVPGVAKVAVFGGDVRSIQVQVHPDELLRYNLSFDDVLAAAKKATAVTRRRLHRDQQPAHRVPVRRPVDRSRRTWGAPWSRARAARASPARDVADVVNAPEPAIGGAAVQGKPGVVLLVSGQLGANTIDVTDRIEEALADLKPVIQKEGVEMRADLFRPADFIGISTHNVQTSLLLGGVLVVVVLILFLFDLRTATISCMAIPLSLSGRHRGAELARRHLERHDARRPRDRHRRGRRRRGHRCREHRTAPAREPAQSGSAGPTADVILNASLEVRGAVVYATFAVILVFLPVVMLPGLAGRFFAPLGLAYVLAILASLVVALVVTPALCMAAGGPRPRRPTASRAAPMTHP